MKIYLIRHGRQNSRLCNTNAPLSDAGKEQSMLAGIRMKNWGIGTIYSSDLIRAAQTADIMNEVISAKRKVISQLREMDFGRMTGHSDEENFEMFGDYLMEMHNMQEDLPYPGGESALMAWQRGMPVLKRIVGTNTENVAVVTHGGLIRCMLTGILGMDFAKKGLLARKLENTSITELEYDRQYNRFTLERFNDYAHLESIPRLRRDAWLKS